MVIVTRYALALQAKFATPLVPSPQTMGDDDIVPERARRFDGRNVRDCEIEVGIIGDAEVKRGAGRRRQGSPNK
jgi:hypothetical protein